MRATPFFVTEARAQLEHVRRLLLHAQTDEVSHEEYDLAERLVEGVTRSARGALPSAPRREALPDVVPQPDGAGYRLRNAHVDARVGADGTLVELRIDGGPNFVKRALRLARYVDRGKLAWRLRVRMTGISADADGVEIAYAFGSSAAVMRVSLGERATALAVEIAVAWNERHRMLRLEHELAFLADRATSGSVHGERYARIERAHGGVALLTPDAGRWRVATRRTTSLGHSLLGGDSERGEHHFRFALRPFAALGFGELETEWKTFADANGSGVPMFTTADPAVIVVATKPADDGDGIIVRARECDGAQRCVAIRSAVRARTVEAVDSGERPLPSDLRFEEESFVASFRPFEVRSFRVRVG